MERDDDMFQHDQADITIISHVLRDASERAGMSLGVIHISADAKNAHFGTPPS